MYMYHLYGRFYVFHLDYYSPLDSTQKPGPGAHSPESVTVNKKASPKFSLGIRHSEYVTPLIIEVRD